MGSVKTGFAGGDVGAVVGGTLDVGGVVGAMVIVGTDVAVVGGGTGVGFLLAGFFVLCDGGVLGGEDVGGAEVGGVLVGGAVVGETVGIECPPLADVEELLWCRTIAVLMSAMISATTAMAIPIRSHRGGLALIGDTD